MATLDEFVRLIYGSVPPVPLCQAVPACAPIPIDAGSVQEWRLELGPGLPSVWVLVALPHNRPAPCLVGLNFEGNHAAFADPAIRVHDRWMPTGWRGAVGNRADASGRGAAAARWPLHLALARGWGVITASYSDIQEDRPAGSGVLQAWQGRHNAGAIAAWSWALSAIASWAARQPEIDAARLVAVGHSRLGKTALLAAAIDQRFAMCIPSQSGTGGVAPNLTPSPEGEGVARITHAFPHWFVPGYGTQTALEQSQLLSLVAPRPLLITNASEDLWADPAGQWRMLRAAAPAWGLSLPADPPPIGVRLPTPLGWWMRPGVHDQTAAEITTWIDAASEALGA
jgi:hypothetical protein